MASPQRRLEAHASFIAPGYSFKMIDGLVTNFHAPDSTLPMLVAAFVGGPGKLRRFMYAIAPSIVLSYSDS